ncbi:MAG: heme biosynthesis HemY N-terminal domain-containing protein [Pseudomonadota bacterium]
MLWSLIKIIVFVVAVAGLAYGAGYLLESQGGMMVTVMGEEYTFGPLQSVIAILTLMFLVWVLLKLFSLAVATWHFLNGDETALSRYWDRNRERKGYDAISQGMMALASGDGRVAVSKAMKAEKYLNKPELTSLLVAQAAEMSGDKRKAEETYRKMIENEATRFVGVRGIMKQKLEDGEKETALALAERAFALKPKHEEVGDALLSMQAEKEDWKGARQTLDMKLRNGQIAKDLHKRRSAVLALAEAKVLQAAGEDARARDLAIEANRLSPDLIPATVMAAHALIAQDKQRQAARLLTKAWAAQPHPDYGAAFAAIAPGESPSARIKRFETLTRAQPDHPETKMLNAELHVAAEDFPGARRALGDLAESDPTTRSVTLMAAIERGEGSSDTIVKGWLAKAVTVSRGPQWVCDVCQNIESQWTAICSNCGAFDSLTWRVPTAAEAANSGAVQMLPLIVGRIEDQSKADAQTVEPTEADIVVEATAKEAPEAAKATG